MNDSKSCSVCGKDIPEGRARRNAFYCSEFCSKQAQKIKWNNAQDTSPDIKLSRSTSGAMRELLVCSILMKFGYDVFRSMSPSCPCDILIMKDGKISRVEVTTGYKNLKGWWSWSKHDPKNYDIIAVVFPSDDVKFMDVDDKEINL